jgi:hypothetical protein
MISLPQIAAACVAAGTIGGGALALDKLHVAAADFDQYIEQRAMADERDYVLTLKQDIRAVRSALQSNPDDAYMIDELAGLMDELCDIRPDDRLCNEVV